MAAPDIPSDADWVGLAALLDDDAEVGDAVLAALAAHHDPWPVLLDALDDAGALACLDVADTGDLLVEAVSALPRVARAGRRVDLRPVCDVDDLAEAIAGANARLAVVGLRLVALDEGDGDDECLPLVAVPAARLEQVETLLTAVGRPALALPTAT